MKNFWNEKRLRNYPRIVFIGVWIAMLMNILFHHGWLGGFGGVIGVDIISNYASGLQYKYNINDLYSLQSQDEFQQSIYKQEDRIGQYSIFISPPFVALINSFVTLLPFGYAFVIWTLLSITLGLFSIYLIERFLISENLKYHLTFSQLFFLVFGFPPLVFGLMFGQNHLLTLLLLTGILILSIKEHWFLAGIVLGLLMYKPHLVIGFLIIFLVYKRLKTLLGFSLITILWAGIVVIQHGFQPYLSYYEFLVGELYLIIQTGMLDTTLFALVVSATHGFIQDFIRSIVPYWIALFSLLLAMVITTPPVKTSKISVYILAILFPYIVSPHLLLYELSSLFLVMILWARDNPSPKMIKLSIFTYISVLIFGVLSKITGISLFGIIPTMLCFLVLREMVLLYKINPDRHISY